MSSEKVVEKKKKIRFKYGENVTWKGESGEKSGKVMLIVPKGRPVLQSLKPKKEFSDWVKSKLARRYNPNNIGSTEAKDHVTYLVDCGGKIFWPKVEKMEQSL